ncbi:MAG: hypothetical protein O7H41_21800 [Planctomycetota bacterium]|nr:hypothetical protein [Planctomycetota bacterium]
MDTVPDTPQEAEPSELVVGLSDIHLGAFNSPWTFFFDEDDPRVRQAFCNDAVQLAALKPTAAWALCEALGRSIESETNEAAGGGTQGLRRVLVLNGDILDLSLAPMALALLNARCFFFWVQTMGFDEVIFVPGNHDHHLWRMVLESRALASAVSGGRGTYPRVTETPTEAPALASLLGYAQPLKFVYPHYIHTVAGSDRKGRGKWDVVFHHGHLLQRWWTLFSTLLPPEHVKGPSLNDLETINEPLTELLWFAVGDAGRLSDVVSRLYTGVSDKERLTLELKDVMREVVAGLGKWGVQFPWWVHKKFIHAVLGAMARRIAMPPDESNGASIAASSMRGLELNDVLRRSVKEYRNRYASLAKSCFVLGHTHRTQSTMGGDHSLNFGMRDLELEAANETTTNGADDIFNTGGWVVEPGTANPDSSYFLLVGSILRLVPVTIPQAALDTARQYSSLSA